MTNLIATDLQGTEVSSAVVDLFEITTESGTFYFHPGIGEDLDDVQFRDKVGGAIRTYNAIPMMLDGVDLSATGASHRPNLTIANVTSELKTTVGITDYDDLTGATLVRRQTLQKYLVGNSGDSTPPVEMTTASYKIDRVSALNAIAVTFELAAVYDLQGIALPRRVMVGKYCSWIYQGFELQDNGGCVWKKNSKVRTVDPSNANAYVEHDVLYNQEDKPLVDNAYLSGRSNWATATAYNQDSYVKFSGKIYRAQIPHTSSATNDPTDNTGHWIEALAWTAYSASATYTTGALVKASCLASGKTLTTIFRSLQTNNLNNAPSLSSGFWEREELCSKTLNGCKSRYGARQVSTAANSAPSAKHDSSAVLPFGGFVGTLKF